MLDLLWYKYWVATLSASPLISNREFAAGQISDVAEKLEQAEGQISGSGRYGRCPYCTAPRGILLSPLAFVGSQLQALWSPACLGHAAMHASMSQYACAIFAARTQFRFLPGAGGGAGDRSKKSGTEEPLQQTYGARRGKDLHRLAKVWFALAIATCVVHHRHFSQAICASSMQDARALKTQRATKALVWPAECQDAVHP
eukprot:659923-Pelagomonas_calceolata.AAC.1